MALWGCSFTFNGVPCEDYDLMMYNIDGVSSNTGGFSPVSIVESAPATRWKPLFFGTVIKEKLTFSIVFGINEKRIDRQLYLTRYEIEEVASWLMGHQQYMWLEIHQEDMEYIHYRCLVTGLELLEFGNIPTAFKATFTCDSPYAYMYPSVYEYSVNGRLDVKLYNESSINGYYKPKIEIDLNTGSMFSIINYTDDPSIMLFSNLPSSVSKIIIDNENGILSSNDPNVNLYQYFNFRFLRLVKGLNHLRLFAENKVAIMYLEAKNFKECFAKTLRGEWDVGPTRRK